jgi:uncharacterized repeat protein (TIGR01451 family)
LRRFSISCIFLLTALLALIGAAGAAADVQIGSAVPPAESTTTSCINGLVIVQFTSDPGIPYAPPPGDRQLTRWEMNTSGDVAGAAVTLVVLRPAEEGSYDVLATDTEALPDPLPADEVASFRPVSPIPVSGGDVLGLYSTGGVNCFFDGGTTPTAASIAALGAAVAPAPGQSLEPILTPSSGGATLNLAATLHGDQDLGVTTAASPAGPTVGGLALFRSTITNRGPEATPVTFTDTVPSGLAVDAVFAGANSCTTAGQTVTCTIEGLAVGQSTPVSVLVTPTAAGSYVNTVSVTPQAGTVDPMPADDSASARLDVAPPAATNEKSTPIDTNTRACVVPNLRRVKIGPVRRLLGPLGCKLGKVRHVRNPKVAKGTLIRTTPGPGTYAAGRRIGLVVSSGPPRRRHHPR